MNDTVSAARRDDRIDLGLLLVGVVTLTAAFGVFYGVLWGQPVGGGGGGETAVLPNQQPAPNAQPNPAAQQQIFPLQPTDSPRQVTLPDFAPPTILTQTDAVWTLTPRATFAVSARVVGVQAYSDWQGVISPLDLALAWGRLSNPRVDQHIEWSQSERWYHYRWQNDSPFQFEQIRDESTNVHIIPANEKIATQLAQIEVDDFVYLAGQLVDVTYAKDGEPMRLVKTSLTRDDTGGGACEILLVEIVLIEGMPTR